MSQKPRPNLLDVARHAGVSPATVSRVLNNTAPVRSSVRERVLASLKGLGYEPPSTRITPYLKEATIAVVLPDILNPYFTEILRGIQDEAGADGSLLLLFDTGEDSQREQMGLRLLANRGVSGIIVCASRLVTADLIAVAARYSTPVVVLNRKIADPKIPCILIDFENATYRATRHLLSLKHTRIAYCSGPERSEASQGRRRGVESALVEAGLELRPEWCPTTFPNVDGGFQAMSVLLALPPAERPTAVIAYNDIMALGVLHAARNAHIRVPEDMSVVGFDDIAMAAHADPPLTTIAQPKYRMGELAMQIIRQMVQGHMTFADGYTLLESSLVVRESTGPAPA